MLREIWYVIRGFDWRAFFGHGNEPVVKRRIVFGQLSKHQSLKKGLLCDVSASN